MAVEFRNGHHPPEPPLPRHNLETITRQVQVSEIQSVPFRIQLFDTLPVNGTHKGTIVSDPGLGAHPESRSTHELRHLLNKESYGVVEWFEKAWGNRLDRLGKDSSRENERALICHDVIMREVEERNAQRGVAKIHGMGWSRGAAIAAASAGRDSNSLETLTIICPGFMEDTSWKAAKRYLWGRATDVASGVKRYGASHLGEFVPFLRAGFANPLRMIHRGGATAGWAPIPEMFAASVAGVPITIIQGDNDETFPSPVVRNNIETGYRELYDALAGNEDATVFEESRTLEELMPVFDSVPGGHGIGTPEEAADIIIRHMNRMQEQREKMRLLTTQPAL